MIKKATLPLLLILLGWFCFASVPALGQTDGAGSEPELTESDAIITEVTETDAAQSDDQDDASEAAPAPEDDELPADAESPARASDLSLSEADEDDSQFDVTLEGRKTWTIRYGFGSPLGLATSGVTPGQMSLDQSLAVDIVGEALSVLTIEAHYDDQMPETLQSLALYLDTDRLDGVLGDFTFGSIPGFAAYSKKMKGLQLEYLIGDAVLTGVISKTEGVSETLVFVGQTAHAETQFALYNESGDPSAYRANLNGLASFELQTLYTEEFSSVHAQFAASAGLGNVLKQYEMGYLNDAVIGEPQLEVKSQNYRVLDLDDQILLLQRDPKLLVRDWLKKLIEVYNNQIAPEDSVAKSYPLTPGTDYELELLAAALPYAQLVVDDVVYPLDMAQARRFYDLGHTDVRESSVLVQISPDGIAFETIPNYRFPDYAIAVHAEAGVLECDFPASFYTETSQLSVALDYVVSDGAYMLGFSLIPESERVTLNSRLLTRDIDYMIDYEVGMLFMLIELAETDVLQIDYELYSGGFGSTSDYASYFYGLTLDLPVSEWLTLQANLLQLAEVAGSATDAQSLRTMPNRHTIAGVQADLSWDDLTATVLVGYNQDQFPFDANERIPGANRINAVAAGEGYILFGHRDGITVNEDGDWQSYGLESGLSSLVVQAVAFGDNVAYIGTDAGLTAVWLDGASPFDRAANWQRLTVDDGLPDPSVTALLVRDGMVWMGTQNGIVAMPDHEDAPAEDWIILEATEGESLPAITALADEEASIYIGTVSGLYVYNEQANTLALMPGTQGDHINALQLADGTLYVASDRGLRGFRNGSGTGWLELGERVYSLAYVQNVLYYGTDEGLVALSSTGASTMAAGWSITALTASDDGLWAGVQASQSYAMTVWQVSSKGAKPFLGTITGIPGIDTHAYTDSPASENTTTGWLTRASFQQNAEGYSLSGVIEALPPTFRAIGSSRRADNTGWTLAGDIELGRQGNLRIDHDYRMTDQSGDSPSDRMANGATLDWSFLDGPHWQVMLQWVDANETDSIGDKNARETTMSVLTQESFFRDALSLTLSWERFSFAASRWDEQWQRDQLAMTVDWQVTRALSTHATWTRPVRFIDDSITGSERAAWDWDWTHSLGFARLDVEYALDWSRGLFKQDSDWAHQAEARLDGESFEVLGWKFSPDFKLEGSYEDASADAHAEFVMRSDIEEFTLRSTIRGHLTDLGRPVVNREVELLLNAKYSGFADLDLSMTYNGSRSAAVKQDEVAPASSDSLTGRLVWTPEEGPRDELSFYLRVKESQSSKQVTASIDNALTVNLSPLVTRWLTLTEEAAESGYPIADLRLDSSAEYRGGTADPEFTFSTSARLFLAMAQRWNVSFGTTYNMGVKTVIGFYNSLALELTFAIEF